MTDQRSSLTPTARPAGYPGRALAAMLTAGVLVLSGCGAERDPSSPSNGGDGHYPVTVSSCGQDVTFGEEPQRAVLLKSAAVPALHELGVLDSVVAKGGAYPMESYDDATQAQLEAIPSMGGEVDSSGHLHLSKETVMAQEPDVVMGQTENLDVGALSAVGIPMLEEPALCPGGIEDPGFDDIYDQLRVYGSVFDREDRAEESIEQLQQRVSDVEEQVEDATADQEEPLSAAVLYPTVGGGATYAYGAHSMAAHQLEAAGLDNVFEDLDDRVVEVTPEELIGRDPDVLILLYSEGDPREVEDAVRAIPGADQISAVDHDRLMAMPMNETEPATPQTVDGLEKIVERFVA